MTSVLPKPKLAWILAVAAIIVALTPHAWSATKYKVLHNFGPPGGNDGSQPYGPLLFDSSGSLYGVTANGGSGCGGSGCGTVFELAPEGSSKWGERILYEFTGTGNDYSAFPEGNLIQDAAGNLYGFVKSDYGSYADVFELSPGSGGWNLNLIWTQGASAGLLLDVAGDLYGFCSEGQKGMIGELSPGSNGWTYTDLYDGSCGYSSGGALAASPLTCPDGSVPLAPLTWDAGGNLYGTTLYGGNYPPKCGGSVGCGVAFRMTPNGDGTWTYHVLHRFAATKTDGYYPYAGLTVDASGTAYGLTSAGGKYGTGTFFKLTPTKSGLWKETILYQFPNCANGCGPSYTLVLDKAGNLYGSGAGGLHCGYDCGTVFKFARQTNGTWKYSVVHKFNGKDGEFPFGVVLDDKGNIFGTTMNGGKYNWGVAFEITP